jgi:hypothetical protein
VFELGQRADYFDLDAELFAEFASEGGGRRFAGFDLAAGEFPFQREVFVRRALRDEHATSGVFDNSGNDGDGRLVHHERHETHEII